MIVDKHILSEIFDNKLEKFVAPLFAKIADLEAELEKRSIDHLHDLDEAKEDACKVWSLQPQGFDN